MPAVTHRYVTLTEANSFLGISGEDTLIDSLIQGAESLFENLVGIEQDNTTGLLTSDKTEFFEVNDLSKTYFQRNRVFDLQTFLPTSVKTVNGVAVGTKDVDYTITRQRLEFKYPQLCPNTFPYRYAIVYTSGFADIAHVPDDIKTAIKMLVSGFYNTKNAQGIQSFRQDLLTVAYKDGSILDKVLDGAGNTFLQAVITNYSVFPTFS